MVINNTYTTNEAKGKREDLIDKIYNVDPHETPFISAIGKTGAEATYHEWQVDSLAAPDPDNAQAEGSDSRPAQQVDPTERLGNYTQIMTKDIVVSKTVQAVRKAGRKNELKYQTLKRLKELRLDKELIFSGKQASNPNDSGKRRSGGFAAFLKSNVDRGTGGASGGFANGIVSAPTAASSKRAFTEKLLTSTMQKCWQNGGNPSLALMSATNKTKLSQFSGGHSTNLDAKDKKVINAIDIYESDYGTLHVKPSRHTPQDAVLLIDSKMVKVAILRSPKSEQLAKTGDNEKWQIVDETTLEVCNEKAHGLIDDLL